MRYVSCTGKFVAMESLCLRRRGVTTNARTAVILGIKAEGVGIGFRHAEGLVTITRRVMADMDLVVEGTAGVILDDAEVLVGIVSFGVAHDFLKFMRAALLGLSLLDSFGDPSALLRFFFGCFFCDRCATLFRRTRVHAGKLESVLDGLTFLTGVATFGNFRVVTEVEEGIRSLTVRHPDVDNRNLGVAHAPGHKIGFQDILNIFFTETLGFSERSGVILGVYARTGATEGVLHSEAYMSSILEGDSNRKFGIHGFSLVRNQDGIRKRTTRGRSIGGSLGGGRSGRR